MTAVLYFIFFIIYLLVTLVIISLAYRFAKRHYKKGWMGGGVAALVMYHLVFWDWVPVLFIHEYYCETQAGFWVYKKPQEWLSEFPEAKTEDFGSIKRDWNKNNLTKRLSDNSELQRYWYSDRIYIEIIHSVPAHAISKVEEKLVDAKTNQVLSKAIEFYRGHRGFGLGLTGLKIWLGMGKRTCGPDRDAGFRHNFDKYINDFGNMQKHGG